jgi:hypothetical protein
VRRWNIKVLIRMLVTPFSSEIERIDDALAPDGFKEGLQSITNVGIIVRHVDDCAPRFPTLAPR